MDFQAKRQFVLGSMMAPEGVQADGAYIQHVALDEDDADWSAPAAGGVDATSNPGFFGVQTPDMLEDMGVQKEEDDNRPTLFKRT